MPRPSFQKLILQPTLQSRQLRIPDDFLRKHGAQLSTIATLKVPDGTVWRLGLKNVDNHICFVDGWQDFVQRYSISIGYFLVFTYEGNSNFIVHIFNMSAAELNYRSATSSRTEGACHGNYHPIFQDIEDIDSDSPPSNFTPGALQDKVFAGSMDQLTPAKNNIQLRHENNDAKNTSSRKRKSDLSAPETSAENDEEVERNRSYESASARIRRNVDNGERERVLNESEAFESTLPNCRVILRPSYLYRGCIMYFPSSFAANLSDVSGSIKLQTSDGGKQWPVRCLYKEGQAKLSQGWYEFALENNLGEGDVCVFERLKTSETVLQVTLFCLKED